MDRIAVAPDFRLQSFANEFIEHELGAVDEVYIQVAHSEAAKDESSIHVEPLSVVPWTKEMRLQHEQFERATRTFAAKTKKNYRECDWEDVLRELRDLKRVKRESSWFERWSSNFHKYEHGFCAWMRLLPGESLQGSLICGGMKLIFQAAASVSKMNQQVGSVLERIPVTVSKVNEQLRLYSSATRETCVSQLFCVLLKLLEECMDFMSASAMKKLARGIMQQDELANSLKKHFAAFCMLEGRIDDKIQLKAQHDIVHIRKVSDHQVYQLKDVGDNVEDVRGMIASLRESMTKLLAEREKDTALRVAQDERERLEKEADKQKEMWKDEARAWRAHCVDDWIRCFTMSPTNYPRARDKASEMLKEPIVQQWLDTNDSALLLVNSNEADYCESAASIFSATLLSAAESKLYWFGGLNIHATIDDVVTAMCAQIGAANGLEQLAQALLAYKKPLVVVFDSISCYQDERLGGLMQLYEVLSDVVARRYGPPLKVLLTSPTVCPWIGSDSDIRKPAVLYMN